MPIPLYYNRTRYNMLPNLLNEEDLFKFTLKDLKLDCVKQLRVPYQQIRLICSGALMKDDNSTLAAYGINERSKILMLPITGHETANISTDSKPTQKETIQSEPKSAQQTTSDSTSTESSEQLFEKKTGTLIETVKTETFQKVQSVLQTYSDQCQNFCSLYTSPSYQDPNYVSERKKLEDKYLMCNEVLLGGLMKLDGISTNPDVEHLTMEMANTVRRLREKRKKAVNYLQEFSDGMDSCHNRLKAEHPIKRN